MIVCTERVHEGGGGYREGRDEISKWRKREEEGEGDRREDCRGGILPSSLTIGPLLFF